MDIRQIPYPEKFLFVNVEVNTVRDGYYDYTNLK